MQNNALIGREMNRAAFIWYLRIHMYEEDKDEFECENIFQIFHKF